jgi:hypothetical protein
MTFGDHPASSEAPPEQEVVRLILIRRDPTSQAQWDVARATMPRATTTTTTMTTTITNLTAPPPSSQLSSGRPAPSPEAAKNRRGNHQSEPGNAILIEVLNPGYSKFAGARPTSLRPPPSLSSRSTMHEQANGANGTAIFSGAGMNGDRLAATAAPAPPLPQSQVVFCRQIVRGGLRSSLEPPSPPRRLLRHRQRSQGASELAHDTRFSMSSEMLGPARTFGEPPLQALSSPPRLAAAASGGGGGGGGPKERGHAFLSPWDGLCEFWTGPSGRSLKVRLLLCYVLCLFFFPFSFFLHKIKGRY